MRHPLDLRSLAYLVCGPLLVAGLFGLLTAIHVPSTTTVDEASCGTVLDHSDYQLLDTRTADASRVTRPRVIAVGRKPDDDGQMPGDV